MNVLAKLILPNFKAIAGGLGSAAALNALDTIGGVCDIEGGANMLWASLGAYVIGHAMTWISPANKSD